MGIRSTYNLDPIRVAREAIKATGEIERRKSALARRLTYEDNGEDLIKDELGRIIKDQTVRARLYPYAKLAKSQSLAKRIINDLADPIYLTPPVRTVIPAEQSKVWADIEAETNLDELMDTALHLAVACNTSFIHPRYVPRLKRIVCSVIPADQVTVIEDPDDPLLMLAFLYKKWVRLPTGQRVTWWVYWDDSEYFQLDHNGNVAPFEAGGPAVNEHPYGIIPILDMHVVPRTGGCYWNSTTGDDLQEMQNVASVNTAMMLRKLKSKGFRPMAITGDIKNVPKEQVLDEESPIVLPDGTQINELGSEATADNFLTLIDALGTSAAASRGISKKRLNRDDTGGKFSSDDTGLDEQRAKLIKYVVNAEKRLFEILKLISREYPEDAKRLDPKATMGLDFGELSSRVDPMDNLAIWKERRSQGVANILDQIKADNPEIRTDADAEDEYNRNIEIENRLIAARVARNVAAEDVAGNMLSPGPLGAKGNGALGSAVRDGDISGDQAAALASGENKPQEK